MFRNNLKKNSLKGLVGDHGRPCPVFCPTMCDEDQLMCPEGFDDNNCPMPDYCTPKGGKKIIAYYVKNISSKGLQMTEMSQKKQKKLFLHYRNFS